jgi:hypothetical protein
MIPQPNSEMIALVAIIAAVIVAAIVLILVIYWASIRVKICCEEYPSRERSPSMAAYERSDSPRCPLWNGEARGTSHRGGEEKQRSEEAIQFRYFSICEGPIVGFPFRGIPPSVVPKSLPSPTFAVRPFQ